MRDCKNYPDSEWCKILIPIVNKVIEKNSTVCNCNITDTEKDEVKEVVICSYTEPVIVDNCENGVCVKNDTDTHDCVDIFGQDTL